MPERYWIKCQEPGHDHDVNHDPKIDLDEERFFCLEPADGDTEEMAGMKKYIKDAGIRYEEATEYWRSQAKKLEQLEKNYKTLEGIKKKEGVKPFSEYISLPVDIGWKSSEKDIYYKVVEIDKKSLVGVVELLEKKILEAKEYRLQAEYANARLQNPREEFSQEIRSLEEQLKCERQEKDHFRTRFNEVCGELDKKGFISRILS